MKAYLLVMLGSAIGGALRFGLGNAWSEKFGPAYLATICVNVSGSLAIGFLAALAPQPGARQLLMVGLLGGYTTFSSFSLQTLELAQASRWNAVVANVLLSVVLSLAAVWVGFLAGTMLRR